ncbi:uncharacterized protein FFB20_07833 [Fusarium fujikuroi]|uniref:Uncharacterized protein n=2 Tax=Fusarium fujikuroi TaxID=5127 RepID=S0DYR2_GIBF5|nr:uncharacterized protein FFUJ_02549 [Fusarium fujikuroi IMI 58289]KLP08161.1 uncharacterized protein Y057_11704 [Fusarium fujikuroi]KLP18492.1 uncharacterized protein LW94_922 [Fusarium fujikuroi]QGI61759.1 hypothetical protein CEK27_005730 [Fusarium fujikuroi]QGI78945.1 hypothetical protein CEK25_005674 [Fusarium fujikuroi]QGI92658.1 hypothetical protein CEK26_005727 [Fusarium fujikuroi]
MESSGTSRSWFEAEIQRQRNVIFEAIVVPLCNNDTIQKTPLHPEHDLQYIHSYRCSIVNTKGPIPVFIAPNSGLIDPLNGIFQSSGVPSQLADWEVDIKHKEYPNFYTPTDLKPNRSSVKENWRRYDEAIKHWIAFGHKLDDESRKVWLENAGDLSTTTTTTKITSHKFYRNGKTWADLTFLKIIFGLDHVSSGAATAKFQKLFPASDITAWDFNLDGPANGAQFSHNVKLELVPDSLTPKKDIRLRTLDPSQPAKDLPDPSLSAAISPGNNLPTPTSIGSKDRKGDSGSPGLKRLILEHDDTKKKRLEKLAMELDAREKTLDAWERELNAREKDLDGRQISLGNLQQRLNVHEEDISKREREMTHKEGSIRRLRFVHYPESEPDQRLAGDREIPERHYLDYCDGI